MAKISEGFDSMQEDLNVAENALERALGRVLELSAEEYHELKIAQIVFLECKKALENRT